jgi:cytochrome c biogenesis protein CcmG/thiol:disulfide interchange protein DsbE
MYKIAVSLFIIILFSFTGCDKNVSNEKAVTLESVTKGESIAPDFSLANAAGGDIKLSDYKGKVVIVDFWATWCPPCRKGIPDLIELKNEYGDKIAIIGISVDTDSKGEVVPFIKKMGINYPVAYATPEVTQSYGGVDAIPTSFVVDKEGKIVDMHVGLVPKADFTAVIDKLLNKS